MCASLEEAQGGVSHHLVAQLEDEYTNVQRMLYPENSGTRYPLQEETFDAVDLTPLVC
jgi:hypothetical protein